MSDTITTLNETPGASRLHIGLLGLRNSGKSSLLNAFTGQQVSIVSETAGTTTDPVRKPMEVHGIGPCVFLDTAGFDDEGELGAARVEKTRNAAEKMDVALVLFCSAGFTGGEADWQMELQWFAEMMRKGVPTVAVLSKTDLLPTDTHSQMKAHLKKLLVRALSDKKLSEEGSAALARVELALPEQSSSEEQEPVLTSATTGTGLEALKKRLIRLVPESFLTDSVTGALAAEGDTVLLVMPQDIQAPKGRLILPQVQTIRDLLDKKCLVMSVTTDKLQEGLAALAKPPALIITDSQVFSKVYSQKPKESRLTSFSVLFAAYKGDLPYYAESVKVIDSLTPDSRVLIAECCTHAPLSEDIGRVKIPRMLRQRIGEGLAVEMASGTDFPDDLTGYDLVIQCGGCMFNRRYILSRTGRAKEQGVPMTNYGVVIAHMTGILDKISM